MTTIFEFDAQVDRFAARINAAVDEALRQIALALYRGLKEKTPVDTGYARANWIPYIGSAQPELRPAPDDSSADAYAGQDVAVIDAADGRFVVWIVNAVPYAARLEYGHSMQAPQGMVRITIEEVKDRMGKIIAAAVVA